MKKWEYKAVRTTYIEKVVDEWTKQGWIPHLVTAHSEKILHNGAFEETAFFLIIFKKLYR